MNYSPKQRIVAALERAMPLTGPVPHFELVFLLTMEAFGELHINYRNYYNWEQLSATEKIASP